MHIIQDKIENLLRRKIGLSSSSIGSQKIARAIEYRRLICNLPDLNSYWQYLQKNQGELQFLIESVTIPETWFFRDQKPFQYISKYVKNTWFPRNVNQVLQALSFPCSTGEEAYSLVMTLLDFGLYFHQFNIDAIDINNGSLSKAKKGFYTNNSFRQKPFDYRDKYFEKLDNGYQIKQEIINKVNFQCGNILDPFLLINKQYDIIFCRNLLIYLEPSARDKVLSLLQRLLKSDGLLFVGSGESAILDQRFISIRQPFTFAYQKKKNTNIINNNNYQKKRDILTAKKSLNSPILVTNLTEKKSLIKENISSVNNLEIARKLANNGQLQAAVTICNDFLKDNLTNAEVYVLLGEIHEGLNKQIQAEEYYQKALYLQPNYYEALVHLALLKENKGDLEGAKLIRQRLERVLKSKN